MPSRGKAQQVPGRRIDGGDVRLRETAEQREGARSRPGTQIHDLPWWCR